MFDFQLVITRLGERFGINCPSAFMKILQFENFQESGGRSIPKNRPKQTYGYWLITPNQKALCIETNIF